MVAGLNLENLLEKEEIKYLFNYKMKLSFLFSIFSYFQNIDSLNNTEFIKNHSKDLPYQVEENQFINQEYDNAVFFSSRYIYRESLFINRYLHSDFSLMIQRSLQNIGTKILIVPLRLEL